MCFLKGNDSMKYLEKISRKKGFTLVECVVAMALFAIMSVILFGILAITQKQAKMNRDNQNDLSDQMRDVASYGSQGNSATYDVDSDGSLEFSLEANVNGVTGGTGSTLVISYDKISRSGSTDLTTGAALALQGMRANAIKYDVTNPGTIKTYGVKGLTSVVVTNGGCSSEVYTIRININDARKGNAAYTEEALSNEAVTIQLPTGYTISDLSVDSKAGSGNDPYILNGNQILISPKDINGFKNYSAQISFKLSNNTSGISYDASGNTLFGDSEATAWFVTSGNTITFVESEQDSGLYQSNA